MVALAVTACEERIQRFLDRDLRAWNGLPEGCSEAMLASWLPFSEGWGSTRRGSHDAEYSFRALVHPQFREPVFFYFTDANLAFVETEFWSSERAECAQVLEELGEPEQRLDLYFREHVIPSGLWLHATKGAAVGVIPETQLIAVITVFPKCSAQDFTRRYTKTSLAREFLLR